MRPNCPICGLAPIDTIEMDYAIPDGWTLPTHYAWRLCNCGFIWADTDATPDDFDQHYREHYIQYIDVHDIHRQRQLAGFIFTHVQPGTRVVDFGGGDSIIVKQLQELGFTAQAVNLDDEMPECDVVVMSQVIEHLYDLHGTMTKVYGRLNDNGILIVETPDAYTYSFRDSPPMLDYYPTHVNHFTAQSLNNFMANNGFTTFEIYKGIEYRATNASILRGVFTKNGHKGMFERVRLKLSELKPIGIDEQVIVYGLGDIALHQIAQSGLNIAYFVDENPIYKGAHINGIPIKDHIDSEHPVLVIGNRQKSEILAKLAGVKNRLITL